MSAPLWTIDEMAAAMQAERVGALPDTTGGIGIDIHAIIHGDAYFAMTGERHDDGYFVFAARAAGAALAVVAAGKSASMPADTPLLVVPDVLAALRDLAAAARARSRAKVVAVTGSVGKTSTKEALRLALQTDGETHASAASFNNHWGVPCSLARLPATARYAVFEIGMNHAGEITPLTRLVRPHIAVVTGVEAVHLEFFATLDEIAEAKAEIFLGLEAGGAAVINRDSPWYAQLRRRAKQAGAERVVGFGQHPRADARLIECALHAHGSTVEASIFGTRLTYAIGAPGRHFALNSLAVLAAAALAGADIGLAAQALAHQAPAAGRGVRTLFDLANGTALLIDESYNANPASMRAALSVLGQAPIGPQGRRIAVVGDMLELGPTAPELHCALAEVIRREGVDLVFCAGPLMQILWDALPPERRGGYATRAEELGPAVVSAMRDGDAVMIKGSLGSRMGRIVTLLTRRFPVRAPLQQIPA